MISSFQIKNFLTFGCIEATHLRPVNIFIAPTECNSTSLLKLLYCVSKSLKNYQTSQSVVQQSFKKVLSEKLLNTFQPRKNGLGELVNRGQSDKLSTEMVFENNQVIHFSFGETTTTNIVDCTEDSEINKQIEEHNSIFVPAKEVLTAFDAIALTRERFNMIGFDDTYYDLILDLRVPVQQGRIISEFSKVNNELEELFEGTIVQGPKENPFLFKKGKTEYSMPLTAEGIKKVGILTTLIKNRRLNRNTVLFMDEPETALHPKAVRSLAEMIVMMGKAGVQVFITSHNYFLIKQLAIIAKRDKTSINCFSLTREKDQPISCLKSDLREGVPDNPIITEALEMFNDEIKLDLGI